jgi:hypothetical protein
VNNPYIALFAFASFTVPLAIMAHVHSTIELQRSEARRDVTRRSYVDIVRIAYGLIVGVCSVTVWLKLNNVIPFSAPMVVMGNVAFIVSCISVAIALVAFTITYLSFLGFLKRN